MKGSYWAWVAHPTKVEPVPGSIIDLAYNNPHGTVRILFPPIRGWREGSAFVNGDPRDSLWLSCIGCYSMEEDCPEHGTEVTSGS